MSICKKTYLRVANKEAEERLHKLLDFLNEIGCGHYFTAEKLDGDQHYVQVIVDIKVSASNSAKKRIMSIDE